MKWSTKDFALLLFFFAQHTYELSVHHTKIARQFASTQPYAQEMRLQFRFRLRFSAAAAATATACAAGAGAAAAAANIVSSFSPLALSLFNFTFLRVVCSLFTDFILATEHTTHHHYIFGHFFIFIYTVAAVLLLARAHTTETMMKKNIYIIEIQLLCVVCARCDVILKCSKLELHNYSLYYYDFFFRLPFFFVSLLATRESRLFTKNKRTKRQKKEFLYFSLV